MSTNEGQVAPASGSFDDIASFEELAADPEIAALLDFEPVPMRPRVNGWDPDAQRAFIALFAITGSKLHAAKAAGRNPGGIDRMLKRPDADGFRDAFDRALDLFRMSHRWRQLAALLDGSVHCRRLIRSACRCRKYRATFRAARERRQSGRELSGPEDRGRRRHHGRPYAAGRRTAGSGVDRQCKNMDQRRRPEQLMNDESTQSGNDIC